MAFVHLLEGLCQRNGNGTQEAQKGHKAQKDLSCSFLCLLWPPRLFALCRASVPSGKAYKTYFRANCIILGSKADVTWPNNELFKLVLGLPGRIKFSTLNASPRNSSRCFSDTANRRVSPAS